MESSHPHRGFSLIELLVVLAIIGIISVVVITSQTKFNKTLVLANTGYDLALSLRQAQTFGLGSRISTTTTPTNTNIGYGIHFASSTPTQFTLFIDAYPAPSTTSCHPTSDALAPNAQPGNCSYDPQQGETIVSNTLGNGIKISDFCYWKGGPWVCKSAGSTFSLDIVFSRPNADPFFSVNGTYSSISPVISKACITLSSQQGTFRYVSVAASGQITASDSPCP